MTNIPSWMNSAHENKQGNIVSDKKKSKPGPQKSDIKRKNVGFKISEERNKEIDKLKKLLEQESLQITRGRSEAVELAVSVVIDLLHESENKPKIIALLEKEIAQPR